MNILEYMPPIPIPAPVAPVRFLSNDWHEKHHVFNTCTNSKSCQHIRVQKYYHVIQLCKLEEHNGGDD